MLAAMIHYENVMYQESLTHTSRFWVEKSAWKRRKNMSFFFSAIDVLAQVHKV